MEALTFKENEEVRMMLESVSPKFRKEMALNFVSVNNLEALISNLDKLLDEDRLDVAQAIIKKDYQLAFSVMAVLSDKEKDILSKRIIDSGLKKSRK
jgi:hypothetical protein